jgi:hypothetical protein
MITIWMKYYLHGCVCGLAELQGVVGHDMDGAKKKFPDVTFHVQNLELVSMLLTVT